MTENPRVVQGFIDIFGDWIDRYGIDGFRIDTARHVNPEFWQAFVPAMLERAPANGIPNFHIFGEVSPTRGRGAARALHARGQLPSVLDFAFAGAVGRRGGQGRHQGWRGCSRTTGCTRAAHRRRCGLPTFLGNHDMGRFGHIVAPRDRGSRRRNAAARCGRNAMLFLLRGVPVIYYGDEQGFVGHGVDQAARQDLFPSQVATYNDNALLGTKATTADGNFDRAIRCTGRLPNFAAAQAVPGLAPRPAGRAQALGDAGAVRGFAHRQRRPGNRDGVQHFGPAAGRAGGDRSGHVVQATARQVRRSRRRREFAGSLRRSTSGLRCGRSAMKSRRSAAVTCCWPAGRRLHRRDRRHVSLARRHAHRHGHARRRRPPRLCDRARPARHRRVAARLHPDRRTEARAQLRLDGRRRSVDETWEQPWGERRYVRNRYNELRAAPRREDGAGRRLDVVFRVFDDGVGFRYEFPEQAAARRRRHRRRADRVRGRRAGDRLVDSGGRLESLRVPLPNARRSPRSARRTRR